MTVLRALGVFPRTFDASLKNGAIVNIKVIKMLEGDQWQVSISGKLFKVATSIPLKAGLQLQARVEWHGSRLLLRALDEDHSVQRQLLELGITDDSISRYVLGAFRRSHMPLEINRLEVIRKLLARLRNPGAQKARIATIMLDKGLIPNEEMVEEVTQAFFGGRRDGQPQGGHERGDKDDTYGQETELGDQLSEQCAAIDDEGNLLQLFNHTIAVNANWIVIPFRTKDSGEFIEGSLRIRTDQGGKILQAAVTAQTSSDRWEFFLHGMDESRRKITAMCSDERMRGLGKRLLPDLREKLHNMGFDLDDNIGQIEAYDGFDLGSFEEPKGVDTLI